jgi:germination protein M
MQRLKKALVLVLLAVILVLPGCTKANPPADPGQSNNPTPAPQTTDVAVYYVKNNNNEMYLVREVHKIPKTEQIAQAALNELITGTPATSGAVKVLPANTKILGIKIDQGLATVDFSPEVLRANVGASGEALGIASIVNTLTEFPTIQKVSFTVEGKLDTAMDWWGHVGLYEQPFKRNLSQVYEPVIWVTAPVSGQIITSPLTIKGNARIFEAQVNFRLRDSNGTVLAQGSAMASEGAPGRGDFTGQLIFTTANPGQGQLEVFEVSMKDGSDQNKVIIPVEW